MKKRWLVSSIACIFVGSFFIIVNINANFRIVEGWGVNCWYRAFGQIEMEYDPCKGAFDGFILGVVVFAVGVLLIIIPNIKKIKN